MRLAGRADEQRRLGELIADARSGRSGCVVVVGDAGIGKSGLIAWARDHVGAEMPLLEVCGVESESELPFAGLGRLVKPILDRIQHLPDHLRAPLASALALGPGAPGERFTTYIATVGLLGSAAAERGLLVLVDDLHLLDEPSREAVLFAARRLDVEGVAMVLATRPDDSRPLSDAGQILPLGGLDPTAAGELLSEIRPESRLAPAVEAELVRLTDGNPLALGECAAMLSADQLAGRDPLPSPIPTGAALERAFGSTLVGLPERCREALVVAAADPTDLAVVVRAIEARGLAIADLEPAESAGILRLVGGQISFDHPLRRSAVYQSASLSQRRAAHLALAEAYPSDTVANRAWHLALATPGPDDEVAALLEAAAADARVRRAYAVAAQAMERSANHTATGDARATRLLMAAFDRIMAGQLDHGAALLEEASSMASAPPLTRQLAQMTARSQLMRGAPTAAAECLAAEAELVASEDAAAAASLLAEAAMALLLAGTPSESDAYATRAVELAESVGGEPLDLSRLVRAAGRVFAGQPDGAAELTESIPFLQASLTPERAQLALTFGAWPLTWIDQTDAAGGLLDRAIAQARDHAPSWLPLALPIRAVIDLRTGRPTSALAAASEGVQLARDMEASTFLCFALAILVSVKAVICDEADVRATGDQAMEVIRALDKSMGSFVSSSMGQLELSLSRADRALAHLAPLADVPELATVGEPGFLRWKQDWIEALIRTGRTGDAQTALAEFEQQADRTQRLSAQAAVARCRGLLSKDYAEHFEEALRLHVVLGDVLEGARTALCYGERLRQANRRSEARDQLHTALEEFDRMGASRWWARTRHELRVAGERVGERTPAGREQLSPRELQVALVVARGATNNEAAAALFLSARTVDTHLTRIYRKLRVRSRTELANALRSGVEETLMS